MLLGFFFFLLLGLNSNTFPDLVVVSNHSSSGCSCTWREQTNVFLHKSEQYCFERVCLQYHIFGSHNPPLSWWFVGQSAGQRNREAASWNFSQRIILYCIKAPWSSISIGCRWSSRLIRPPWKSIIKGRPPHLTAWPTPLRPWHMQINETLRGKVARPRAREGDSVKEGLKRNGSRRANGSISDHWTIGWSSPRLTTSQTATTVTCPGRVENIAAWKGCYQIFYQQSEGRNLTCKIKNVREELLKNKASKKGGGTTVFDWSNSLCFTFRYDQVVFRLFFQDRESVNNPKDRSHWATRVGRRSIKPLMSTSACLSMSVSAPPITSAMHH